MPLNDHYRTLNIKPTADKQEIKAAYRRLVRKYHPDVSTDENAEDKIKKINEAYEILSNLAKKERYDSQRSAQQSKGNHYNTGFNPPPGWKAGNYSANFFEDIINKERSEASEKSKPSDFFDKIFTGRKKQASPNSKDNIATISLRLDDIHMGNSRNIRLPNGQQIKVKIPKGIQEGQYIRLPKKKNSTALLLKVKILPHPLFQLEGKDLHLTLPVAPWESALGSSITIPTLEKSVKLTIPEGTQSGTVMRLKGRGLTGKPNGDLLITIMINIPPALSDKERRFYKKMQTAFKWNPRSRMF